MAYAAETFACKLARVLYQSTDCVTFLQLTGLLVLGVSLQGLTRRGMQADPKIGIRRASLSTGGFP
jgi:hypothetical protein